MTRWQLAIWIAVLALAVLTVLAARTAVVAATQERDEHAHAEHGHSAEAHEHADPHAEHGHAAEAHGGRSFADAERWAQRFESPERNEWQMPDKVVEALRPAPGDSVADIGSGTGYFARRFAAAVSPGGTVYASDIEPGMAAYVRDRADRDGQRNLVPVLASFDDPRLPDGAVDLVFICNTWHHIGDRVDYARRLRGDLAPGGRVAIVDFLPGELPVGPPPGEKLSADEVTAEFRSAGYRRVAAPELLPYQYILIFEPAEARRER